MTTKPITTGSTAGDNAQAESVRWGTLNTLDRLAGLYPNNAALIASAKEEVEQGVGHYADAAWWCAQANNADLSREILKAHVAREV